MFERINGYSLLSNRVYDAIKDAIIKNKFIPGEKITESMLAEEFGVSRTPIREALRSLYGEGYVVLMPNSSFAVNAFTEKDVSEILEARGAIEGMAAYLAAQRITSKQARELENVYKEIEVIKDPAENEEYANQFHSADLNFHDKILEIAGNSKFIAIEKSLHDRMYRLRIAISKMPNDIKICAEQHKDIMDAIISKEAEMADSLSKKHTRFISETVVPFGLHVFS